jgi:hypothetical protein
LAALPPEAVPEAMPAFLTAPSSLPAAEVRGHDQPLLCAQQARFAERTDQNSAISTHFHTLMIYQSGKGARNASAFLGGKKMWY